MIHAYKQYIQKEKQYLNATLLLYVFVLWSVNVSLICLL